MNKRGIGVAVSALALTVLAVTRAAVPQVSPLKAYVDALQKAEGLKATYTVQVLGGPSSQYVVNLAKPNLARIDKPNMTIVADGEKITFFDKKEQHYYTRVQTPAELNALFDNDESRVWSGFFDAKAFDKIPAKSEPNITRKGIEMKVVRATIDAASGKVMTLFLAASDGIARQATLDAIDKGTKVTTLVDTLALTLNKPGEKTVYAWVPPAGTKEIKEEDLISSEWVYSLDEAKKLATKSHRRIMVHFTADWCSWCRKIEKEVYSTPEFKKMGKYFVFCQIDIDKEVDLKTEFGVSGIPDIRFLEADGKTEVHKVVGYKPKDEFLADMQQAIP